VIEGYRKPPDRCPNAAAAQPSSEQKSPSGIAVHSTPSLGHLGCAAAVGRKLVPPCSAWRFRGGETSMARGHSRQSARARPSLEYLVKARSLGYAQLMTTSDAASRPLRLIPTGKCWCGCDQDTARGAFFLQGHDKRAEAALVAIEYHGSVAELLHRHGYGPGRPITRDAVSEGVWSECTYCGFAGGSVSVRAHLQKHHPVDRLTGAQIAAELDALERSPRKGMATTREIELLGRK
jgi:hypothetical protein